MVDKNVPKYVFQKDGTYYFSRHVPLDVRQFYSRPRIVICLKTQNSYLASRSCKSISSKLDDYWMKLRLTEIEVPASHLLKTVSSPKSILSKQPRLSEALERYVRLKGAGKPKTFFTAAKRNIGYVITKFGDRSIDTYSSSEAANMRDHLLGRGLKVTSVSRIFATIRAVVNLTIGEEGLDLRNPFANTFLPKDPNHEKRKAIPLDVIKKLQAECLRVRDPNRLLIALISDTGMRLSEAVGLVWDDVVLDHQHPHINLKPHSWRGLKTVGSKRQIPLVGASLRAIKVMHQLPQGNPFLFNKYANENGCNGNSASAALNKWLKPRVPTGCVMHSFRHSMRDRLRYANVSSEVIDEICGWASQNIGTNYGEGYSLNQKYKLLDSVVLDNDL